MSYEFVPDSRDNIESGLMRMPRRVKWHVQPRVQDNHHNERFPMCDDRRSDCINGLKCDDPQPVGQLHREVRTLFLSLSVLAEIMSIAAVSRDSVPIERRQAMAQK
jgi:hypothetical protein